MVGTATTETSMKGPKKTKNRTIVWSSYPISGRVTRQSCNPKGTRTSRFTAALFTRANTCETTPRPIHRGMGKEDVVHTDDGILLSHGKEWNNAICSDMDGPSDDHAKQIKSDRETRILYVTCGIWNMTLTYLWNRKRFTDIENRLVITKGARDGEGGSGKLGLADVSFGIENG